MYQSAEAGLKLPEVLSCLASSKPALIKMKGKGKPYDGLIDEIVAFPGEEDERPQPTNTNIQKALNITSSKLKKWIDALYDDFIDFIRLPDAKAISFGPIPVSFSVQGDDGDISFYCSVSVVPRIGEHVQLPFLYPTIGYCRLYVHQIYHDYDCDQGGVSIHLNTLSPYATNLKERAQFEGKLGGPNSPKFSNRELIEALQKWYPPTTHYWPNEPKRPHRKPRFGGRYD